MKRNLLILGAVALLCLPAVASADGKPIQLALYEPVQLVSADQSITGLRINLIYGINQNVTGIDLGLVNKVRGNMKGYQSGIVNLVDGDFSGLQDGWVNCVKGKSVGVQAGLYNYSEKFSELQFGVWNTTGDLHGLQIGLLNFNKSGKPMGFLPIVNFSF